MSDKKLTKQQQQALDKVRKIGEISLLQLDRQHVGISIKTVEGCKLSTIGEPVRNLLSDLIDCMEDMGANATIEDFNEWQRVQKSTGN